VQTVREGSDQQPEDQEGTMHSTASPPLRRFRRLSTTFPTLLTVALLGILAAAALTATACGGSGKAPPAADDTAAAGAAGDDGGNARLATLPEEDDGDTESDELPPGHPPIDPSASGLPPVPSVGGTAKELVWDVPADWEEVPPASSMRHAQYRVPGPGGDGELVVFYFGPGQGGDARANAERWAGQFQGPGGGPAPMDTRTLEVGGRPVLMVEVHGTYSGGMTMMGAPSQSLDSYMLLGAIAEGPDAPWFFKLTGPEATLEAQRDAFDRLVQSLHAGA
jgi:hypothetical protein